MKNLTRSGGWALLAALASLPASGFAEPPVQRQGVASCAQSFCHGSARPLTASRVLQNEYVTWSNFDPHARALDVLRNERSRQIARRLGLASAYDAPACRACHADNVPATLQGPRYQASDGIGCETCHGSAQRWIAQHSQADTTHAQNLQRGLVALEQASVRARVCSSCHVGDKNRLATHAMMAAGHPRLAFELDTFSEIWRTRGGREHYRRDADYLARKGDSMGLRVWFAGLVQSAQLRLDVVEGHVRSAGLLPDFAIYNCYSCHRSMRTERWSEGESSQLPPGEVRFDSSAVRMLIAVFDGLKLPLAGDLRSAELQWQRAASDAKSLPEAQRKLAAVLQRAAQSGAAVQSRGAARAMLDSLVASAQRGDYPDYNAAEQAAMGMVVLLAEQGADRHSRPDIDALFKAMEDDSRYDARRFAELAKALGTAKPALKP